MRLYKFEAQINGDHAVGIVVAAESETAAFDTAETELEKAYLKTPLIEELSLTDTRIIRKNAGFVIGEQPS